jgi:hypothetical protein
MPKLYLKNDAVLFDVLHLNVGIINKKHKFFGHQNIIS